MTLRHSSVQFIYKFVDPTLNDCCLLYPAPPWLVKDMHGPFVALLFTKPLESGQAAFWPHSS